MTSARDADCGRASVGSRYHPALASIVSDDFEDDRSPGCVIGTKASTGALRLGVDKEGLVAIDNGALRFQPLLHPGWARQGIAYGPFARSAGLILGVAINNGHNTSQGGPIPESFLGRVRQWSLGPHVDPLAARLLAWLMAPRRRATLRKLRCWLASSRKASRSGTLEESLAIGFYSSVAPPDPLVEGSGFVLHAAEAENGELWLRSADRCLSAFRRLKNVPLVYVVALRDEGACYYVAGPQGAHGVGGFPRLRPVGIDAFDRTALLYAGVHQAALGQIGFRVDTRVSSVQVAKAPELIAWYGSAHAADGLQGNQDDLGRAEHGGAWRVLGDQRLVRTPDGAVALGTARALLDPHKPSGLIHAIVEIRHADDRVALLWKADADGNGLGLECDARECRLVHRKSGTDRVIARDPARSMTVGRKHELQVLEGYGELGCYLDGEKIFGEWLEIAEQASGTAVGISIAGAGARISRFEAHPTEVAMPSSLDFAPPWSREGSRLLIVDSFEGRSGDIAGRQTEIGGVAWKRSLGVGNIVADGRGSAQIAASVAKPNPGRTLYTLPWSAPDFAELEIAITPPGTARHEGHRGRAGLVFWQDRTNYVTCSCWLDDIYGGASISFFPKRFGFEELYDAVWTNVDRRIFWGRRLILRVAFDGNDFLVRIDGEPVLQKSLRDIYPHDPPLRIERVGLVSNWEWGNDTGSQLADFRAWA